MSFLSSSKKLDYTGDDNVDWDNVHPALDTNKYSHLAEEKMLVVILETELQFAEITTTEDILFYPSHPFPFPIIYIILTFVWSTFAGATATAEGNTSSNIVAMIEKLTNWTVQKFPRSVLRTLQRVHPV